MRTILIYIRYGHFDGICNPSVNGGIARHNKKTDRRGFHVPSLQAGLENPAYRR